MMGRPEEREQMVKKEEKRYSSRGLGHDGEEGAAREKEGTEGDRKEK